MAFFIMLCLVFNSFVTHAQTSSADKNLTDNNVVKKEILSALELWNTCAKNKDTIHFMELFDNSEAIMIVGSDSGEVFKGKEQVEGWLRMLFSHRSFSWEMNRVDIDHNGNTAWVFMDGSMIVTNDRGKTAKFPYRFTGVLVKVNESWKWRLFNGSVPGGH